MGQMMELPDDPQAGPTVCHGMKDSFGGVSQAWT